MTIAGRRKKKRHVLMFLCLIQMGFIFGFNLTFINSQYKQTLVNFIYIRFYNSREEIYHVRDSQHDTSYETIGCNTLSLIL